MANVISVNASLPKTVEWKGRRFTTAIDKQPVEGPAHLAGINLEGDDQADRTVQGGTDKAVYAYASEDYAWWTNEVGHALPPGRFGENLTVSGVDLGALLIGERWRAGTALLEVSEPRMPCFKLGYAMDDPRFVKRFAAALRFGAYFRIIEAGDVAAGSALVREAAAAPPSLSVRDMGRIVLFAPDERAQLTRVSALSADWRTWAADRGD